MDETLEDDLQEQRKEPNEHLQSKGEAHNWITSGLSLHRGEASIVAMAKLLMGVVVEVLFNRPRTIQVFPITSEGGVSNSALYSLTWRKMRRKITREPSFSAAEYTHGLSYSDESWIPMPDCFSPNGWEVVVKVVDKTSDIIGDLSIEQDLIIKDQCIDRGHLGKDYFPIIGAALEDLSKDEEWTKGEQVNAVYSVAEDKTHMVDCCYGSSIPNPFQFSKMLNDQVAKDGKKEFMGKSETLSLKSPLEECKKQLPDIVKSFSLSDESGLDGDERAEKRVRGSRSFCNNNCQVQLPQKNLKSPLSEGTDTHKVIQISKKMLCGFRGIAFRLHHHSVKEAGMAVMGVSAACGIAFIVTLIAFWLPCESETTICLLIKFGAIACAAGVFATIGKDLLPEYMWAAALAFLVSAAVVALS